MKKLSSRCDDDDREGSLVAVALAVVVIELKELMPEAVEAMHHATWIHCSSSNSCRKRIDAIIINFHNAKMLQIQN